MVFRTAVDWWFYGFVFVLPVLELVFIFGFVPVDSIALKLAIIAVLGLAAAYPIWLLFSTYYSVEDGLLRIRAGNFHWQIPLKDITSVQDSSSLISSPALSLERLDIRYGDGKSILVSPADQDGFLAAIGHRCSDE